MVHIWFGGEQWGLVEDGGEMIVVSIVLYYVFRHQFEYAPATVENMPLAAGTRPLVAVQSGRPA